MAFRRKPVATDDGRLVQGDFRVRPRIAAYWASGLFACAFAGLVVALVTDDGDDLATVALILAIVAFALQIVFFAGQLWVAAEQDRRGAQLYTETASLLTQIDASAEQTVSIIKEQFRFVLEHALAPRPSLGVPDLGESVAGEGPSSEAVVADIVTGDAKPSDANADEIAELRSQVSALESRFAARSSGQVVRAWDQIGSGPPQGPQTSALSAARQRRLRSVVQSWPGPELGPSALQAVETLSDAGRRALKSLAKRWRDAAKQGTLPSGYLVNFEQPILDDLVASGLVESYRSRSEKGEVGTAVKWTDLGSAAARILTATGALPAWAEAEIDRIEALGPLDEKPALT